MTVTLALSAMSLSLTRRAAAATCFSSKAIQSVARKTTSTACPSENLGKWPSSKRTLGQIMSFRSAASSTTASGEQDQQIKNESAYKKTVSSTWNLQGLIKETNRLALRCHKKISKTFTRYNNAQEEIDRLTSEGANSSLTELEQCLELDSIQMELEQLRKRLSDLNALEDMLLELQMSTGKKKSSAVVLPEDLASLAIELEVNDALPERNEPVKKAKQAQENNGPRKPYRRYYTENNTEIRVSQTNWFITSRGCSSHTAFCSDYVSLLNLLMWFDFIGREKGRRQRRTVRRSQTS